MADGNFWFVNHCEYSRWESVDQIKTCSFEDFQPILNEYGVPYEYKSDNGSPFQSYKFAF